LDRRGPEEEALGDLTVREAFGDEDEDLPFPLGQAVGELRRRWCAGPDGLDQASLYLLVENRLAGSRGLEGAPDVIAPRVLGQEPDGAGRERTEHRLIVRIGRQ